MSCSGVRVSGAVEAVATLEVVDAGGLDKGVIEVVVPEVSVGTEEFSLEVLGVVRRGRAEVVSGP